MKELVILSGKGGTGKTSLTASFAVLASGCLLCDADVDAADLHLLMQPDIKQRTDFQGGGVAIIDSQRCTGCGTCIDMCRWSAIGRLLVKVAGCAWIFVRSRLLISPPKPVVSGLFQIPVAVPWCMPGWGSQRKTPANW